MLEYIPNFGSLGLTVVAFLVALSVIVTVHEYGHYIVGRWSGIHAEVFSLGFGPALWARTDRRGTRWQVAAIPLGGYVKFLGDANAASAGADDEVMAGLSDAERRHTMHGAPLWARAATIAAGPIFNFILAVILFSGVFWFTEVPSNPPTIKSLIELPGGTGELQVGDEILAVEGVPTPDWDAIAGLDEEVIAKPTLTYQVRRDGAVIDVTGPTLTPPRAGTIDPNSAAEEAGLKDGDVVLSIDGTEIRTFQDIRPLVEKAEGRAATLVVWRAGETFEVKLTPRVSDRPKDGGGFEKRILLGLFGGSFFTPVTRENTILEALEGGAKQTWEVMTLSLSSLGHIVTGSISHCNLSGALSIAETSGQAASQGFSDFIFFLALLSAGIGLVNLFPIPILDGGHLVFCTYEALTGRPLPEKVMNMALSIGLFVVLGLMIFGLSNDILCP